MDKEILQAENDKLNARLQKAIKVFGEQKRQIESLTSKNEELTEENSRYAKTIEEFKNIADELEAVKTERDKFKETSKKYYESVQNYMKTEMECHNMENELRKEAEEREVKYNTIIANMQKDMDELDAINTANKDQMIILNDTIEDKDKTIEKLTNTINDLQAKLDNNGKEVEALTKKYEDESSNYKAALEKSTNCIKEIHNVISRGSFPGLIDDPTLSI